MEEYEFMQYVNDIAYLALRGIVLRDDLPKDQRLCAHCVSGLADDERLKEAKQHSKGETK